jgi:glycerophosphoryl diester phosphodiesterase
LGHRGGGTLAPENTLAGLLTASHYGFQGVEFDAKLTRDGVAILLHDDTLDRTTNGGGPVAQADWVALRCLDAGGWRDARFTGEPTHLRRPRVVPRPTLAERRDQACPGREEETGAVVAPSAAPLAGRDLRCSRRFRPYRWRRLVTARSAARPAGR